MNDVPKSTKDGARIAALVTITFLLSVVAGSVQKKPSPTGGRETVDYDFTLEFDRVQECPNMASLDTYTRLHPFWGIP